MKMYYDMSTELRHGAEIIVVDRRSGWRPETMAGQ